MKIEANHMADALFRSLKKKSNRLPLVDYGLPGPFICSRKKLLLLSVKLAGYLRKNCKSQRIGIVLPPGLAGAIANLAVFFAGKTPVNLNFSLGSSVAEKLIQKADIKTIITAEKMMDKFSDFPWTNDIFEISAWLKKLANMPYLLLREVLFLLLPLSLSRFFLKIPTKAISTEATILFTSGSSGDPKGVVLSHQNILSNCSQINQLGLFGEDARLLANLPLFHSFGFTVATCFPLLYDVPIVTVPSPLDVRAGLEAIRKEKITFLLGTPTFLRGFLSRGKPEDFESLKYVVAGAEKTEDSFRVQWEKFASCSYLEGYGLTETAPGISFNLPNDGFRKGSVGRLFHEVECKTIHPETRQDLKKGETGILCFRGPNIFSGYLNDVTKTDEVLTTKKWFITGDIGYLDEAHFLFIKGRLSRFSKIGGEMVPHETIEGEIKKLLTNSGDEETSLVVVGQPDQNKGEQLVLVTEQEIDFLELRKKLSENGLPNLWIPKKVLKIDEIPILPTGKIDIQGVTSLIGKSLNGLRLTNHNTSN
jgi:acyl-[acyl-carrier-protein]-phospholipid O-acyltransferase / long-chain-fatty-acid--[acyl-carrier-protein] ligase